MVNKEDMRDELIKDDVSLDNPRDFNGGCGEKFSIYNKKGKERKIICGNVYKYVCPYNDVSLCDVCLSGGGVL